MVASHSLYSVNMNFMLSSSTYSLIIYSTKGLELFFW